MLRQIDKLKDKKADMIEAVYLGAKDGMSSLTLPKISKPAQSKKRTKQEEICVPLLSDIQLAKNPRLHSSVAERE